MEGLVRRNWLDLAPELWRLIATKIDSNRDFVVFGSVCKRWQLASASVKHPEPPPEFPLLVLSDGTKLKKHTYEEELKNIVQKRTLCNIFSSTSFDINLPEAYGKKCFAVNFGWLLTLSMDEEIELLHPLSRRRIKLPNVQAFSPPHGYETECFADHMFITKAVISCSPNDDGRNHGCYVFIIHYPYRCLAFARIGDEYWTTIQTAEGQHVIDIIYKKDGLLYALDWHGVVSVCDINDEHPTAVSLTTPPPVRLVGESILYLVELGDDLLLVKRIRYEDYVTQEAIEEVKRLSEERYVAPEEVDDIYFPSKDETKSYRTTDFIMFKIEMEMDGRSARCPDKWIQVEELGNRALFVGVNASLCLDSNKMINSNCVYFTDSDHGWYSDNLNGGGYDTGIMNMQDKSILRNFTSSRSFYCTPFWYI